MNNVYGTEWNENGTEWNGDKNVWHSVYGMEGGTSAPVLAAGMNAESQQLWHKSTFGRPDRDGLHPPGLFSNKKKRGREILSWANQNFTIWE